MKPLGLKHVFPLNPDYGRGVYRRRVRLVNETGRTLASVLDDYHDMRCTVEHDATHVTAIACDILRAPYTTCSLADAAVRELIGWPLAVARSELYGSGRAGHNCTHLFDIVAMAMAFASLPVHERTLELVVPDEREDGSMVEAFVDSASVHRWQVKDETILVPQAFQGRGLFRGFIAWAEATFTEVALDAALALQKAVFVARGRRYIVDAGDDRAAVREQPERLGACFTFSEPHFSVARSIPGYVRNFTSGVKDG